MLRKMRISIWFKTNCVNSVLTQIVFVLTVFLNMNYIFDIVPNWQKKVLRVLVTSGIKVPVLTINMLEWTANTKKDINNCCFASVSSCEGYRHAQDTHPCTLKKETRAQSSKGKILHFLTPCCPILITASFYLHCKIAFVFSATLWENIMCWKYSGPSLWAICLLLFLANQSLSRFAVRQSGDVTSMGIEITGICRTDASDRVSSRRLGGPRYYSPPKMDVFLTFCFCFLNTHTHTPKSEGEGTVSTSDCLQAKLLPPIRSRWSPVEKVSAGDLMKGKLGVDEPSESDVKTLTLVPPLRRLAETLRSDLKKKNAVFWRRVAMGCAAEGSKVVWEGLRRLHPIVHHGRRIVRSIRSEQRARGGWSHMKCAIVADADCLCLFPRHCVRVSSDMWTWESLNPQCDTWNTTAFSVVSPSWRPCANPRWSHQDDVRCAMMRY